MLSTRTIKKIKNTETRNSVRPNSVRAIIKLAKRLIPAPVYELKTSSVRRLDRTKEQIGLMDGVYRNKWR